MKNSYAGLEFVYVAHICPDVDEQNNTLEFMPQDRYRNLKDLRLNAYGKGPFCKFRIPRDQRREGVYIITANKIAVYVGECGNLSSRFNNGYGNISPRNCYEGGQETNCRINSLVLKTSRKGEMIQLWFFQTMQRKVIEERLREELHLPWNLS